MSPSLTKALLLNLLWSTPKYLTRALVIIACMTLTSL